MSIDLVTEAAVVAGYAVILVMGTIGVFRCVDIARRLLCLGWAIVAIAWLLFYLLISSTPLSELADAVRGAALWSRVLHFPVVGLGISTLIIFKDREDEARAMWREIEEQIARTEGHDD